MPKNHLTPLGAITKGALAGAVGTAAMDLLWYWRYKRDGGEDSLYDWEFSSGTDSYENAASPAQVGKRVVEGYLQKELPPSSARSMNNVLHWATGIWWGIVHGAVVGSNAEARPVYGLGTGAFAWTMSYAMLAPAGLYQPMWKYPPGVLWKDLSAHLVFGTGTGTTFALLAGDRR